MHERAAIRKPRVQGSVRNVVRCGRPVSRRPRRSTRLNVFYAEGGGQPANRGTLAGVEVVDIQNRKGETVDTLAEIPAVEPGNSVTGSTNESFRTYTMRAHTASHVVYGAGRTLFDVQGYGGFDIAEDRILIDFDTTGAIDDVDPVTVERLVNKVIWDGRSVEWYEMDLETARTDEDIAFNLGDDAEPTDTVRIVEIDGWDRSACGGTHVENTVEIGPIAVLSVSNPGADLVRIEYAVGPSAIQHRVEERRAASRAAGMLDTSVENLIRRVNGFIDENETLRTEREQLSQQLLDTRIGALAENTFVRNGDEWLVGTVDGVGPNDVADRIRTLELEGVDVIVLSWNRWLDVSRRRDRWRARRDRDHGRRYRRVWRRRTANARSGWRARCRSTNGHQVCAQTVSDLRFITAVESSTRGRFDYVCQSGTSRSRNSPCPGLATISP